MQTLIALLNTLEVNRDWLSVTLEPQVASEKVDILLQYPDRTEAIQVKSSENPFGKTDVQRWARDLEAWHVADVYKLILVGPGSSSIAKINQVGKVAVPSPINLDLRGLREQAAHRLHRFLESQGLPLESADRLTDLVALLADDLSSRAVAGQTLTREGLSELLSGWMRRTERGVRIVRVFVSSLADVTAEHAQLDEVVSSINRTEGDAHRVRLELLKWEKDVVPWIDPGRREVIDDQTQRFDVFLGIISTTLGDGETGAEFRTALSSWRQSGSPWILFCFDAKPELSGDPDDAMRWVGVCRFRKEIERLGITTTYAGVRGTKESFYEKVFEHLRKTIHLLAPRRFDAKLPPPPADGTHYLRHLLEKTSYIDIRGLQVGTGQANRFPIEQLFISLTTTGPSTLPESNVNGHHIKPRDSDENQESAIIDQRAVPLHEALRNDRLVIVGDPGAGKTTFLRRVAHALCQTHLGEIAGAAKERLEIDDRIFPIFIRIGDFAQHLLREAHQRMPPAGDDAPAWLPHFLGAASEANSWGLDASFFRQRLEDGQCTVLLDGLDEAPDRSLRERLSRLIENVTRGYSACRFVVTSRPAAYTGEVVLSAFAHARIDPLSDEAVKTFLSRWCEAIYVESGKAAQEHRDELLGAVQSRAQIRRMARNPVMLTALAVVHWNERRLPEQRADLYDSIIRWLSRSREQRPGRATADRTVVLLQELALAMQDDPRGRKTQVPARWGAEKLAGELGSGTIDKDTITRGQRFLEEEEVDSGIVVGRSNEVAYWHLTFQEFLAAKAIASRPEAEQTKILFSDPGRIYLPEWRETLLLLAGVLHQQGKAKVDWLIGKVLDALGQWPDLAAQARCSGLIGNMLRDLGPLKYMVSDTRYDELLDAVMAIFDRERFKNVRMEERIAAADALGQAGDPRIDFTHPDYWVTIPAGKFLMGSQSADEHRPNYDEEAEKYESPVHEVYLDVYRIARFPVTVGQYQRFMEDDGYEEEGCWKAGGFGQFTEPGGWADQKQYPSRPVVQVSWYEAAAFCVWAGFRLPTEAEWERAARGTEGWAYPWGNTRPNADLLNYTRNVGHLTPVGIYPLGNTPDGICDMAGNVWNWCEDRYKVYLDETVSNPQAPNSVPSRLTRGGSWASDAHGCRSAFRFWPMPDWRCVDASFRVVDDLVHATKGMAHM